MASSGLRGLILEMVKKQNTKKPVTLPKPGGNSAEDALEAIKQGDHRAFTSAIRALVQKGTDE